MKRWILLVSAAAVLASTSAMGEVTLMLLLNEMTNFSSVAQWPNPQYTCKQASSYDRATISPDRPGWFANSDQNQFIRAETNQSRTEKVLMDADGPGCIVRFWLTTDRNKKGALRIYLDGAEEPALAFPAYDLLSGDLRIGPPLAQPHPGYQPTENGGNTLYLPIAYARHCKVTWEESGQSSRYYQINYRTYPAGTKVRTFSRAELDTARTTIEQVNRVLLSPPSEANGQIYAGAETITEGAESSFKLPPGPAAVGQLELRVQTNALSSVERSLRSLIIQMECDGERTIWCPVSDFFGSGVGLNAVDTWYRSVHTNGVMVCRWIMPYQKSARLALINRGTQPLHLTLQANVQPWIWDERSMHFHSTWHYEARLKTPPERDWNFVKISGQGVYVGDTLALYNPIVTWYGEGDEKIWVDDDTFPSHMGTGTEDYYGFSYAPKPVHMTPFTGEPRQDHPMTQGHDTLTRTRNLDGIPFRRSLQFDMELISWKPTTLTYAATTYWYARPGASANVLPQSHEAALDVPTLAQAIAASAPARRSGAVEFENIKVLTKSSKLAISSQDMEPFGAERWSNGCQMLGKAAGTSDYLELEWPAQGSSPRNLVLYATQAPDYATLRFTVNGQPIPTVFEGYATSVQPAPAFTLGEFAPQDGKFKLRVEVAGTNPKSTGARFLFGLDCVTMKKNHSGK